jgi:peptidyl-prolyl cis-trans isomerase B (cyclophilin B)
MKTTFLLPIAMLVAVALAGCEQKAVNTSNNSSNAGADFARGNGDKPDNTNLTPTTDSAAPEQTKEKAAERPMTTDVTREPADGEEVAVMETNQGRIVLMFFPDVAPKHVKSFKDLAAKGFYDGVKFHRAIPGFMIQGGDPKTKDDNLQAEWGTGGPGYNLPAEFNKIKHERGILSAARSGHPDSAGSQFFIMHDKAPFLDGQYTVYGRVVSGLETVDKIVNLKTDLSERTGGKILPENPAIIKSVKIEKWPVK